MASIRWWKLAFWASIVATAGGLLSAQQVELAPAAKAATQQRSMHSHRFLAQRGFHSGDKSTHSPAELLQKAHAQHEALKVVAADSGGTSPLSAPWTSIGPSAVQTSTYGLVPGRLTSIAVDP